MRRFDGLVAFLVGLGGVFCVVAVYEAGRQPPVDSSPWWIATAVCLILGFSALILDISIRVFSSGKKATVAIRRRSASTEPLNVPSPAFAVAWGLPEGTGVGATGWGDLELVCDARQPVQVARVSLLPAVRLMAGRDWSFNPDLFGLSTPPIKDAMRGEGAWNHQWKIDDGIWLLTGLPVVLQPRQPLPLPLISVRITNHKEVRARLDAGQRAVLNLQFTVLTDAGRFTPEMNCPLKVQEPPQEEVQGVVVPK